MVASSQVNSDSDSLSSILSEYDSKISSLSSSWMGASYNNLQTKANEFLSYYSSAINSQMTSFSMACDLYEKYLVAKENLEISKNNYNIAVSSEDAASASMYSANISEFTEEMNNLKLQIDSNLQAVSSIKLDLESNNSSVQGAIDWALNIANDNSHGYSRSSRNGSPDYDCSSFVINAYQEAGVPVKEAGASYTGNMKGAFVQSGFEWIPGNPNVDELQPGDVLLSEGSHVEMYIGNGQNVGAHSNYDGSNGDSSGNEIDVGNYYDYPWDGVLRYKDDDNS